MSDREYHNRTCERIAVTQAVYNRRDEVANSRIALGEDQPTDTERAFELLTLAGFVNALVSEGRLVEDCELVDVAAVCQGWLEDRAQERAA